MAAEANDETSTPPPPAPLPSGLWDIIRLALPKRAAVSGFKKHLEAYAEVYREQGQPKRFLEERARDRPRYDRIVEAARVLLSDPALVEYFFEPGLDGVKLVERLKKADDLRDLLSTVDESAKRGLANLARPVKAATLPRDVFLGMVIKLWVDHGGEVGASTNPKTSKAGGPLVRVLCAAAEAAGIKKLSPDAARKVIRAYANGRSLT